MLSGVGGDTGEAECEGLVEELLGLVGDLLPDELRHVLELVKTVRSYLKTRPSG